jgi:hypothetical protein
MPPNEKVDKLDAELKDQEDIMEKLRSTVALNKQASKALERSLEKLGDVTQGLEEEGEKKGPE